MDSDFTALIQARVVKVNSQFATDFKNNMEQFAKQNIWISGASLGPVNDSYYLAIPIHCTLEQAAVQSSSRYFLQADIWDNLTELQKNTLRLHEVLYRTLLSRQVLEDSRPVRALVGLLLSQQITAMTAMETAAFFKTHQIKLNQ